MITVIPEPPFHLARVTTKRPPERRRMLRLRCREDGSSAVEMCSQTMRSEQSSLSCKMYMLIDID